MLEVCRSGINPWDPGSNTGITVAGSTSDPGSWSYQFSSPTSILFDPYGYMYILDTGNSRVQKWYPGGSFGTTIISATMSNPSGLKLDLFSNIVIADRGYHRILSFAMTCPPTTTSTPSPSTISSIPLCSTASWNGTATTVAGSSSTAGSTATLLYYPYDVAFDSYKNMYVVDYYNHRVQRFRPGSNTGTTVAGFNLASGSGRSELYYPSAIVVTDNGTMFILDTYNCRVFQWQVGDPIGTIIVNGRGCGSTFDKISRSYGLFVDNQFNIYISEYLNHRVTKWLNGNNTAALLIAGGNGAGVTMEKLNNPWGIYVNSNGDLFIADRSNNRVQRWDLGAANGVTVAGDSGGVAGIFSYQLNTPTAIMFDQYGYLYILDDGNSRIQKWFPGSSFGTTILSSTFSDPLGMELDQLGNLYVADTNYHRIQQFGVYCPPTTTSTVPPSTQTMVPLCSTGIWNSSLTLVAGSTGTAGNSATFLSSPYDVTFDKYQNIYVADYTNHRIQQFRYGSNIGSTVAGVTGSAGSTFAQLYNPSAIYVNTNDSMYILDTTNYRVLKWQLGDQLGTIVVNGRGSGTTLDKIGTSYAMCFDNQNNIYISEYSNHRVTKWPLSNNTVGQLVAGGSGAGSSSEKLNYPWGIYIDNGNSLYVVDRSNHRIQKWIIGSPNGLTVAGESGVSGPWSYQFSSPTGITFDSYGFMYILDAGNSRIQKWSIGMTYGITVISATLSTPLGMHWDFSNNFYVADTSAHRIITFSLLCPPTTTTTLAFPTLPANLACQTGVFNTSWTVVAGQSTSSGTTSILLSSPIDVFIDGDFNLYVADYANSRIQKFPRGITTGTTVAGFTLTGGSTYSQLYNPTAIFVDLTGAMYIADMTNYRIQKWLPNQPLGFTVAGGRGNGATLDKIGLVYGIFVDSQANIYVSENSNNRVTLWYSFNSTAGEIVAGGSGLGNSSMHLNSPWGVHVDINNTLYIVDRGNHRVQKWLKGYSYGITVAGSTGITGANSSLLNSPTAITFDTDYYMYIMDAGNNRVQRFAPGSLIADTIVAMTFSSPRGMRLDSIGNLYIADQNNHRVIFYRCVYNASTTTMTTVTTTTGPTTSTTTTQTTSTTTSTSTTPPSTTTILTTTISTTTIPTTTTITTVTTTLPTTTGASTTITTAVVTTTDSSTTMITTTTVAITTTPPTTTVPVTTTGAGTTTTVTTQPTTTGAGTTTVTTTTTAAGTTTTGTGVTTVTTIMVTTVSTTTVAGATTITTTTAVGATTIATTTVAGATTILTTTVAGATTIATTTVAGATTIPTTTVAGATTIATTTIAGATTIAATTVAGATTVITTTVAGTTTMPTTTVVGATTVITTTVAGATTIPTTTVAGATTVITTTVAGATTMPSTTVVGATTVITTTVAGATTIPTTTIAGATTIPTTTVAGATTVITTTVAGATTIPTTTVAGATTISTTTVAGATTLPTTTVVGATTITTTTLAGATTTTGVGATTVTTTTLAGATTTTGIGVTTTTTTGSGGGGGGSQTGSDTSTASSQGSGSIGAIAGGAVGGAAVLAGIIYGAARLFKRCKRENSSSGNEVTSIEGKGFTKAENVASTSPNPASPTKTPSNPASTAKVAPNPATNSGTPSNGAPNVNLNRGEPTPLNVNSRTYNIHVIK